VDNWHNKISNNLALIDFEAKNVTETSARIQMSHSTLYRYEMPIFLSPQLIRLRPAAHCLTEIQRYVLTVLPVEHLIHWQQDPFNNYVARLIFPEKITELRLQVDITANIRPINPYDFYIEDYASQGPFTYTDDLQLDLAPYLKSSNRVTEKPTARAQAFFEQFEPSSLGTVDFLVALNQGVYQNVRYIERLEQGVQSSDTTLSLGSGSCRDSAVLLLEAFRYFGLAARFVSGYSIQLAENSTPSSTTASSTDVAKDSTDLHAWAEVFIPGAGWVGFDPSSGLLAGAGYIPLCCTRDPASAAPISGKAGSCETQLFFENTVTRLSNGQ
jgi:transglutaminase-like putative cysteine protease